MFQLKCHVNAHANLNKNKCNYTGPFYLQPIVEIDKPPAKETDLVNTRQGCNHYTKYEPVYCSLVLM